MEPNQTKKLGCGYTTEADMRLYVQLKLNIGKGIALKAHLKKCTKCNAALDAIRKEERSFGNIPS